MKTAAPLSVLFVNMVNPANDIENLYPPLGPAYLAAYAHKHLDQTAAVRFTLISADFEKKIAELKPDIVGITCVSQNFGKAKEIAKYSKSSGVPYVLIGGCHISLCPESLDKSMDIGVLGEGEITFLEIISRLVEKGTITSRDLAAIKGVSYWDKQELQFTPKRELIANLDEIPNPDRGLFVVDAKKSYMFSSRGCPYKCEFCASSRLWDHARFHSAKYVFEEIKALADNYGVERIDFYDDLFVADFNRIEELGNLLEREGYIPKVQFHVSARANLVNDRLCSALKKMNVKGVSLGLESGSPDNLRYLKGGSVTVENNSNAVNTIKKHGLYCVGSFVIGTPVDTRETILETLNFIKKSRLDEFAVYALTPFPGTPVWQYAVDRGLIPKELDKFDWGSIDVEYARAHNKTIHLAINLTRKEFYELFLRFEAERRKRNFKRALKLLFTNPGRFFYHLSKRIRGVLKLKTLISLL